MQLYTYNFGIIYVTNFIYKFSFKIIFKLNWYKTTICNISKANISGYLAGLVLLPIFGNIWKILIFNKFGISNETISSIIIIEKNFLLIVG